MQNCIFEQRSKGFFSIESLKDSPPGEMDPSIREQRVLSQMISWASFIGQMKGPGITCISNMDPSQHQMAGSIKWVDPIFGHQKLPILTWTLVQSCWERGVFTMPKKQVKHM